MTLDDPGAQAQRRRRLLHLGLVCVVVMALVLLASCGPSETEVRAGVPVSGELPVERPVVVADSGLRRAINGITTTTTTTTEPSHNETAGSVAAPAVKSSSVAPPTRSRWGVESCGGSVDVCLARIGSCESTGSVTAPINWTARNPHSTAAGGYQFLQATWDAYGDPRWPTMADAPPAVQTAAAHRLFAARGSQPWFPSERCWRT